MTTLIQTYITEITTLSPSLYSGLPLPLIFFANPLASTITQELNQLAEDNKKDNHNLGLIQNLSKGLNAYEAYLEKEYETASQAALEELLSDMRDRITKEGSDFILNKNDYRLHRSSPVKKVDKRLRIKKSRLGRS